MLDLETIGYYLYMEEQENRSRELKQAAEREQAPQEEQGQDISAFPGIHAPLWTETDK